MSEIISAIMGIFKYRSDEEMAKLDSFLFNMGPVWMLRHCSLCSAQYENHITCCIS